MPMFERGDSSGFLVVDRWDGGVGWIAHPGETGRRASHAVVEPDSDDVWLFDPLDAPGVHDLVGEQSVGSVAGVAVLSDYHVRDAEHLADRFGVPVTIPEGLDRAAARVDGPVERTEGPIAGFEWQVLKPLHAYREAVAYRASDRTLYVPDFLSSCEPFLVGDERLSMNTLSRLRPPREPFASVDPDRIVLGHGEGIFEGAPDALSDAFGNARRRFPRALRSQFRADLRAFLGAVR